MVSMQRMRDIRQIISKAIYGRKYQDLTSKQALIIAKKVKDVLRRERKRAVMNKKLRKCPKPKGKLINDDKINFYGTNAIRRK